MRVKRSFEVFAYSSTALLLFAVVIAGSYQLMTLQREYGWSYEVTTTIRGVSKTEIHTLSETAMGLVWIFWLLGLDVHHLLKMWSKEPRVNEIEKAAET